MSRSPGHSDDCFTERASSTSRINAGFVTATSRNAAGVENGSTSTSPPSQVIFRISSSPVSRRRSAYDRRGASFDFLEFFNRGAVGMLHSLPALGPYAPVHARIRALDVFDGVLTAKLKIEGVVCPLSIMPCRDACACAFPSRIGSTVM